MIKMKTWKLTLASLAAGAAALALSFAVRSAEAGGARGTTVSFVSPQWVAEHRADEGVRILDVRQDPHDYFRGHVPGAVHMADSTLRGPERGVPVQYLPAQQIAELLARAGVTRDRAVVLYSQGEDVLGASMVAYVLERLGHPRVMIMNGGWEDYAASQPVTQAYPSYVPGRLRVQEDPAIRAQLSDVRWMLGAPGVTFVDARPAPTYRGETDIWMRSGHIPGALNLHWEELVSPENPHRIRPVEELRRIFAEKGLTPERDIVFYCGTSREASLNFVIARHVLGFPRVRLYEGSWTEYSAQPELPVATGPEPGAVQTAR